MLLENRTEERFLYCRNLYPATLGACVVVAVGQVVYDGGVTAGSLLWFSLAIFALPLLFVHRRGNVVGIRSDAVAVYSGVKVIWHHLGPSFVVGWREIETVDVDRVNPASVLQRLGRKVGSITVRSKSGKSKRIYFFGDGKDFAELLRRLQECGVAIREKGVRGTERL